MPYRLIKTTDHRRGRFLFLASLSYIAIGIANVVTRASLSSDLAFAWIPAHLNPKNLGWIWIVTGVIMLITGLIPPGHSKLEAAGYVVSLMPPFAWAFIFSVSQLFGNPYGIRSGVVYFFISILMYYIAGWPNNMTLRKESTDATAS